MTRYDIILLSNHTGVGWHDKNCDKVFEIDSLRTGISMSAGLNGVKTRLVFNQIQI